MEGQYFYEFALIRNRCSIRFHYHPTAVISTTRDLASHLQVKTLSTDRTSRIPRDRIEGSSIDRSCLSIYRFCFVLFISFAENIIYVGKFNVRSDFHI